jgi:hypothetical protein
MGIADQGMFGNSHGKVGNLVYYMRKGKQIVRKIGISTKPPTEAQKENRLRMSVTSAFCKLVRPFTDYGFEGLTVGRDLSPHNVAVSYNKLNALQGAYPDFSIDYARALVAEGPLVHADDAKVEIVNDGLQFSWYVDPQLRWPDTADQAMLLAIFPDQDRMSYQLFGAPRTAGTSLLEISAPMLDKYMETYIAFISADRKQVSTSIYVGALNR